MQNNNQVGVEGAKSIAGALKENSSVQELDLVRSFFGFVCATFLRVLCCCAA
jgi:hypothetical protein